MSSIYNPKRGVAILDIIIFLLIGEGILFLLNTIVNSYIEATLFYVISAVFSLYCIYYILLDISLKYYVIDSGVEIKGLWGLKRVFIPFSNVDGYVIEKEDIKGFRLSGLGRHKYCFGRCVVENVGVAHMFVTSSKEVFYIHTDEISYGISPDDIGEFKKVFQLRGFKEKQFKVKKNKNVDLFKERSFFIPFIIVSLIVVFIILNPFILYLTQKLPNDNMPLAFDSTFTPILYGTAKQFAFKQMIYGAMNMLVLFCMYYAAYFCAKYDRRSAYKYIYISLLVAVTFLVVQLQILNFYL
jgi:hypothetical protein